MNFFSLEDLGSLKRDDHLRGKKKRQWFCQGEPVLDLGNIDLVIYTPPPPSPSHSFAIKVLIKVHGDEREGHLPRFWEHRKWVP